MKLKILTGLLIISLFLISGCITVTDTTSEPEITRVQHLNDLVTENNKHADTFNKDFLLMNAIMGKYNLKTISLDERIEIVNEYVNYYNIRLNHLEDHYNFIINNEQDLKNVGVDTFEDKQNIKDTRTQLQNNIEGMKKDVQEALDREEELRRVQNQQQLTQQQYNDYTALFQLLSGLLI